MYVITILNMVYAEYIGEYMTAAPSLNATGCIAAMTAAYFVHKNKERISDIINKIKS